MPPPVGRGFWGVSLINLCCITPKAFTECNDLAMVSMLGVDGLKCQVTAAVSEAVAAHHHEADRHQTHQVAPPELKKVRLVRRAIQAG